MKGGREKREWWRKERMGETRGKEGRERWRALEEEREERIKKKRRKRNLVWRGIGGKGIGEREKCLRKVMERLRRGKGGGGEDRRGGRKIMLVILEREEDREEILKRKEEVSERWRVSVEEDLTRKERKVRWRIKEKA